MQILLFLGGILIFTIGIWLAFGFNWAMLLLSLVTGTAGSATDTKEANRGSKNQKVRLLGFLFVLIGIFSFLYSLSM